ncbi:hybrid sensor histidine kinase/response regulator [Desulfobacca acetoxidans]|uniref:histidine kinase n=1 Tax=Desulfobacca acetoxidans (strain ATCC 700848 / DSM 11109 / ASRB2) TaxID=880072 RepID=F2ND58_DESAR|nr:response regulator [Desulfobacca acetoxidans]AEB09782.1 putative PAS/PAC sensor protein [Desulfobacca acetoxidans DSM 11109]
MEKHHGCLNTKVIIDYFQEHFPALTPTLLQDLHPEIEVLPNPQEFLTDINNWVSSDVVIQMFKKARSLSQDDEIAFKIGSYAATKQKFGYVQRIITQAFGNPRLALKKIQVISDKFNRNKTVEVQFIGRCQAVVKFRYFRHIPADEDFCLFNRGILTAMPTIWHLPPGDLEERRCYFHGDDYCEYFCTWEDRSRLKKWLRSVFLPWRLLRDTIQELEKDKEILKRKYDEVHHLNLQLKEKIDQLMSLPETCMAALTAVDLKGLLQVTLNFLIRFAKLDRAGVFLLNEASNHLEIHCGVGIDPTLYEKVKDYKIPVSKVDNVIARVAINGIPVVINDVAHSRLNKGNQLIQLFQPKAFILAPISVRGKVIGVILADRMRCDPHIADIDKELVMNFAHQIAMALDSALMHRRLEISERRYRELVENAYEGIWIIDGQGIIRFANRRLREIIDEEHLEGKELSLFLRGDNSKFLATMLVQNRKGKVAQQELELQTPKGKTISVILSSVPLMEEEQYVGSFAMINDVTSMRKMERQLLQQQKMEAIGALASGWARNFNDILINILILNGLVLADLKPTGPGYNDLKQIEQEVTKGAELIDQLLSFGQRHFSLKPVDLNLLIDKIIKLLRFSHKQMRIHYRPGPQVPAAEVDQGQIEQVLVNVLLMGRPRGAKVQEVAISTEEVVLDEEFCQPYNRLPGPYVYIAFNFPQLVVNAELQGKIFEPFVVSEEVGSEGRPSLASVYSIIKNHQGIIEMDSEAAFGTTFHIYLPVSKKPVQTYQPRPLRFVRGSGVILLVDDEEPVRAIGARILGRLGYKVIPAATGMQAIAIVQERREEIDLVVLDMVMPGLSGRETFYRLREIDPEIKVLLYSAHSMDEDVHLMMEKGALGFIQKPYRIAALSQKIAAMLGGGKTVKPEVIDAEDAGTQPENALRDEWSAVSGQ